MFCRTFVGLFSISRSSFAGFIKQKWRTEPCIKPIPVCSIRNRSNTQERTLSLSDQEKVCSDLYHTRHSLNQHKRDEYPHITETRTESSRNDREFFFAYILSIVRFFSISGENSNGTCIFEI